VVIFHLEIIIGNLAEKTPFSVRIVDSAYVSGATMETGIAGTGSNRIEVESSGVIDAPLENLWQLLSDFNIVAQWHSDVTESHLESGSGREAGSVRSVRLRNGISIRECLLAISPQDHSYRYSVIESLPYETTSQRCGSYHSAACKLK
jgi:Polyketide cyclase / dehydrase and lipid transport